MYPYGLLLGAAVDSLGSAKGLYCSRRIYSGAFSAGYDEYDDADDDVDSDWDEGGAELRQGGTCASIGSSQGASSIGIFAPGADSRVFILVLWRAGDVKVSMGRWDDY